MVYLLFVRENTLKYAVSPIVLSAVKPFNVRELLCSSDKAATAHTSRPYVPHHSNQTSLHIKAFGVYMRLLERKQ